MDSQNPTPAPDEPGTLGEQFAAIFLAIYLGEKRKTNAADEWDDARKLIIPHARKRGDE